MQHIDVFIFGDSGPPDAYNPQRLFESSDFQRIVLMIARNLPFTLNCNIISSRLGIELKNTSDMLNKLTQVHQLKS